MITPSLYYPIIYKMQDIMQMEEALGKIKNFMEHSNKQEIK